MDHLSWMVYHGSFIMDGLSWMVYHGWFIMDDGGQHDDSDDGHDNPPFCGNEDNLLGCCCDCCQGSLLTLVSKCISFGM